MDLRKRLHSQRSNQAAKAGINHAARYHYFQPVRRCKQVRNSQRVRYDLWRLAFQMTGDVVNGRPGIDDDTLVRDNELGTGTTNCLFLHQLMGVKSRKGKFIRLWTQYTR